MFLNFSKAKDIYIGNYLGSSFRQFDRLRIYNEEITEDDFEQHIKYGQSYTRTTDNPLKIPCYLKLILTNHMIFSETMKFAMELYQTLR